MVLCLESVLQLLQAVFNISQPLFIGHGGVPIIQGNARNFRLLLDLGHDLLRNEVQVLCPAAFMSRLGSLLGCLVAPLRVVFDPWVNMIILNWSSQGSYGLGRSLYVHSL